MFLDSTFVPVHVRIMLKDLQDPILKAICILFDEHRNNSETLPKPAPRGRRNRNVVVIEKIETEGDRQLKALAEKQLSTKTSLRE